MGPRSKRAERCERCRLHVARCLCASIPRLELATRIVLVMHYREVPKTTATGPLALAALPNSELFVHGRADTQLDLNPLFDQGRRVLLLFPSKEARPLRDVVLQGDPRPVTLIVPDGNWRQATRAARRIPGVERAERVLLPAGTPTEWGLRTEPKVGGLATFEAIARSLGVLESPDVQAQLEELFRRMVKDTWAMRGLEPGRHPEARSPRTSIEVPRSREASSYPTDRRDIGMEADAPMTAVSASIRSIAAAEPELSIVYQDDVLVAVNKPAGALVHRGWGRDGRPVLQRLRDQLGRHVYPVHRLDRATSGVLLFTFDPDDVTLLQAQFNARAVDKFYLGLCRGHDAALVRVDHALAKEKGGARKPAVTEFRLLGSFGRYGLYDVRPLTGRLHQIRKHLKHASHPLIGDVRYGKGDHNRHFRENYDFKRLALHCRGLDFDHPRSGARVSLRAPLPPDFAELLNKIGLAECIETLGLAQDVGSARRETLGLAQCVLPSNAIQGRGSQPELE